MLRNSKLFASLEYCQFLEITVLEVRSWGEGVRVKKAWQGSIVVKQTVKAVGNFNMEKGFWWASGIISKVIGIQ